jgi:hypothetical protein
MKHIEETCYFCNKPGKVIKVMLSSDLEGGLPSLGATYKNMHQRCKFFKLTLPVIVAMICMIATFGTGLGNHQILPWVFLTLGCGSFGVWFHNNY